MRIWSDHEVDFLKLTWPYFTAAEIAQCLNETTHPEIPFTTNAIIGKANRLGLKIIPDKTIRSRISAGVRRSNELRRGWAA